MMNGTSCMRTTKLTGTNIVSRLIEKMFPHDHSKEDHLERLRSMREHCQCASPCPSKSSFFDKIHHRGQSLKLIAYVRANQINGANEQTSKIQQFCKDRGHQIVAVFDHDTVAPEVGLHDALEALNTADGIIVTDLSRMVKHHDDPLRELSPLIHHYFFHEPKHLISIGECIDTTNQEGQEQLIKLLEQLGDVEYRTC